MHQASNAASAQQVSQVSAEMPLPVCETSRPRVHIDESKAHSNVSFRVDVTSKLGVLSSDSSFEDVDPALRRIGEVVQTPLTQPVVVAREWLSDFRSCFCIWFSL